MPAGLRRGCYLDQVSNENEQALTQVTDLAPIPAATDPEPMWHRLQSFPAYESSVPQPRAERCQSPAGRPKNRG